MKERVYLRICYALTLAGVLFSGYLSANKLFTGICAFNEPCPVFLGYPACWYGFGLFLIMFIVTVIASLGKFTARGAKMTLGVISFLGILFAGQFVIQEIQLWMNLAHLPGYKLGLPTCVYGLVFYIAIFVISLLPARRQDEIPGQP